MGDVRVCKNYTGIALISLPRNVFTKITESKLRENLEITIGESQHGFRKTST